MSGFRNDEVDAANLKESALVSKGQRYRFQEQCFLHFWKAEIYKALRGQKRHLLALSPKESLEAAADKTEGTEGHVLGPDHCTSGLFKGSAVACEEVLNYNHITSIIAKEPAKIVSQFNRLNGAEIFFRLDSSILTQLKPEIKLYKIYPSIKEKTDAAEALQYKVPMPLGENILADQEGIPYTSLGKSSIEELFHDQDVLGNVMLTDLSFKFAGKNVALLNTVENVRFTLSFSSFDLFNHEFVTQLMHDDDPRTEQTEPKEPVTWSYKDLISYSTKFMQIPKNSTDISSPTLTDIGCFTSGDKFVNENIEYDMKNPNRKFFEIQMAIRYNPDDIDWEMVRRASTEPVLVKNKKGKMVLQASTTGMALTEDEQEQLSSFLRNSAVMLRLQFVAHTIKYNAKSSGADPELIIDFEYKAFIENSLNSPELDIFNLNAYEVKLATIEQKLEQARRLLIGVSRGRKTLGSIFGADGSHEATDGESFNFQYQQLRKYLKDNAGDLSYLIWNPAIVAQEGGLANIIPTEDHLDKAREEAAKPGPGFLDADITKERKKSADNQDLTSQQWTQIKRGLGSRGQADTKDLDSMLASTGNATQVFEEIVNKIRNYLKSFRRANIGKKYKNIFDYLWRLERVYALDVSEVHASLGFDAGAGTVQPEKTQAEHRQQVRERIEEETKAGKTTEYSKLVPKNVRVVYGSQTTDSELKKILDRYKETHLTAKESADYNESDDSVKTAAQQLAKILGTPELSQPAGGGKNIIYFTTLGDILDVAITIASAPGFGTYANRIGYLLGPLLEHDNTINASVKDPNVRVLFNLAWVPIPLKSLMGFFAQKVMSTGRERYFLGDFIKDMIQDLILPSLGSRCVDDAIEGNQEIGTITFSTEMRENPSYTKDGRDKKFKYIPPFWPATRNVVKTTTSGGEFIKRQNRHYPSNGSSLYGIHADNDMLYDYTLSLIREQGAPIAPISWQKISDWDQTIGGLTSIPPDTPVNRQFNYMFIYVNNFIPSNLDPKNEAQNINNGIYYLHLGKIPSIARGASFTKENIAYLREARAMGQITRTGGMALRDVYRFNCSMYGNNIFKPGMLFFVDPTKDGSANYDQWKDLGIGGFYRIIEVNHAVNAGGDPSHVTSVNAIWETFGGCGNGPALVDMKYVNIISEPGRG